MKTKNPTSYDTILYRVRAGDSLSRVIQHYHGSVTTQQRNALISQIDPGRQSSRNQPKQHFHRPNVTNKYSFTIWFHVG